MYIYIYTHTHIHAYIHTYTAGVRADSPSESWLANHYALIVWKLACMERAFPSVFGGWYLTAGVYMYVCTYVCMADPFHLSLADGISQPVCDMHACPCRYTHTYIHTYIHTCMHTYLHTYIHTYTHTYMARWDSTSPTVT